MISIDEIEMGKALNYLKKLLRAFQLFSEEWKADNY